ncbi:MAG: quinone-dependent dihydroorotate dehydrogenase [Pseudomonadota bacterium]
MSIIDKAGLAILQRLDPERAHALSISALRSGLVPMPDQPDLPSLRTTVAGLDLANPLGLAAGFDKNAVAFGPLTKAGFGFVEVGAVTPKPQFGNPRPRFFRLTDDRAVVNRFGFNNDGAQAVAPRLLARKGKGILGLNIGANKDSIDRAEDFAEVLEICGAGIDFATVNVSSPNTANLRDLQEEEALRLTLERVLEVRGHLEKKPVIFLKIAPDLTPAQLGRIAAVATDLKIDGVIATNTTLDRGGLASRRRTEIGGLSGQPLFEKSTRILAELFELTEGQLPLIGVGGVSSAAQAYAKIKAGASAVQLYTALGYQGLGLVREIIVGLDTLLKRDGFACVADAVGTDHTTWLSDPTDLSSAG